MLYHAYEMTHAAISPMRAAARMGQEVFSNPLNPMADHARDRGRCPPPSRCSSMPRNATASRPSTSTRRWSTGSRPRWPRRSSGRRRSATSALPPRLVAAAARNDPKVLVVAPMSGHYATLLRGTVRDMLPDHDVYITDWIDAREVPVGAGAFDLDDYTDYLIAMIETLSDEGERIAVMARLPARHPGDGRREPDGDGRQPAAPGLAGADGLADRHRPQSQAAERARRQASRSPGSRTTSSCACHGRTRASCAGSIPASCSSRASSR